MSTSISVNGNQIEVPDGSSVLDVINRSGTYIPQLCKDPDMKPIGACRTCLVEIDGMRGYPASCSVPAADGMKVWTDTPGLTAIRKGVVELTLAMLPESGGGDSLTEGDNRDYRELTQAATRHGIDTPRWRGRTREPVDTSNPVFST